MLHSTAQLYSHKRKHERRDFETAYRKYREDQPEADSSSVPEGMGVADHPQVDSDMSPKTGFRIVNGQVVPSFPWKREASDSAGAPEAKRMRGDTMSLPVSIKKEVESDSDGDSLGGVSTEDGVQRIFGVPIDQKFMPQEDEDSKASSDMSGDLMDTSQDQATPHLPMFGGGGQMLKMPPMGSPLIQHAGKISGEKLGDSLTLPIPAYGVGANAGSPTKEPEGAQATTGGVIQGPIHSPQVCTLSLPTKTAIMDKKERDESWKSYLVR